MTMFKKITLSVLFSICISTMMWSQVGIGTTDPKAMLDIQSSDNGILIPRVALTETSDQSPITAPTPEIGLMVFNTATINDVTEGFYYWNGTQWVALGTSVVSEPPIDSVSLSDDVIINSASYTDISGMALTFTARKTSALVNLTASGLGYTGSISIIYLRVQNETDNIIVGGTMEKIQNYTSIAVYGPGNNNSSNSNTTYVSTTWSASFSKLLTGLIVGNTYTLKVQGQANSILGTNGAAIYPVTNPDSNHLTLSVIQ